LLIFCVIFGQPFLRHRFVRFLPHFKNVLLRTILSTSFLSILQNKLLNIRCEIEKLDPFSFEHNFGKYCQILILSLLQTEINCDQVYPKIYHRAPNLLVFSEFFLLKLVNFYKSYASKQIGLFSFGTHRTHCGAKNCTFLFLQ